MNIQSQTFVMPSNFNETFYLFMNDMPTFRRREGEGGDGHHVSKSQGVWNKESKPFVLENDRI